MRNDPESLVRSIYTALADGEIEQALGRFAHHGEVRVPDGLPFGGIYQGIEQIAHLVEALDQHFESLATQPERVLSTPPFVVVLGRHVGRTRAGVDINLPNVGVWRLDDGLVELYKDFTDTATLVRALDPLRPTEPPSA